MQVFLLIFHHFILKFFLLFRTKILLAFLIFIVLTSEVCSVLFECNFVDVSLDWVENTVVDFYQCRARIIQIKSDDTLIGVPGNHTIGKSNFDVNFLWSAFGNLKFIPENLADFFPNIHAIYLIHSNLEKIEMEDLKPFPDLEMLDLRGNKITSLAGDLFMYNKKLRIIDFEGNFIEHIGFNLLKDMNRLWYTNFQSNPCITDSKDFFVHAEINPEKWPVINEQFPIDCPPIESESFRQKLSKFCLIISFLTIGLFKFIS